MKPRDLALDPGAGETRVRWLGTAGFVLEHGAHTLLIDPYLTRAPLWRCLSAPLIPDESLLARQLPRADAIILGHTHFDHALDTPALARRTGALVFGSPSAHALCRAQGVPEAQLREPREAEVGPFRLRFPERAARALTPRTVLLSHWDDFLRPVESGARMLPAMQLPRLVDRLSAATREARIGTLPLLGALQI